MLTLKIIRPLQSLAIISVLRDRYFSCIYVRRVMHFCIENIITLVASGLVCN